MSFILHETHSVNLIEVSPPMTRLRERDLESEHKVYPAHLVVNRIPTPSLKNKMHFEN